MKNVIDMINNYLENPNNPLEFSLNLENILFDLYDQMIQDDKKMTDELNENLPEICAEYEQGYDENQYYQLVKNEIIRIENVIGKKLFKI